MTNTTAKFQQLLRELLQPRCAGLDFGIYRFMSYKRDAVERFVSEDLPKAIAVAQGDKDLEAAVYNHLYGFFSRYWKDGSFIPRRYGLPYNGEDVCLYWATRDQYYVKTGEYLTDYTWEAPNGVTVRFKLQAADVEQNNVKGEKRFFLPLTDQLTWDAEGRTLTIPFHFRPPHRAGSHHLRAKESAGGHHRQGNGGAHTETQRAQRKSWCLCVFV